MRLHNLTEFCNWCLSYLVVKLASLLCGFRSMHADTCLPTQAQASATYFSLMKENCDY